MIYIILIPAGVLIAYLLYKNYKLKQHTDKHVEKRILEDKINTYQTKYIHEDNEGIRENYLKVLNKLYKEHDKTKKK